MQKTLEGISINDSIDQKLLYRAKRIGFSDYQISKMIKKTEIYVRDLRESYSIRPVVKQLDTVAAEYPCFTNYLYLTYNGEIFIEKNFCSVIEKLKMSSPLGDGEI